RALAVLAVAGGRLQGLAGRAPVGRARQLGTLRGFLDDRAVPVARPARAVVDPEPRRRELRAGLRIERRRPAGGGAPPGIVDEEPAARLDDPVDRLVVNIGDLLERADLLEEQDLALVDVADAGHRPLVEEDVADLGAGALGGPDSAMGLRRIELRVEEVR